MKPILKFSSGGITLKEGQEVDLAAYESYISLPSSSIIDILPISPENILLIDDYESVFREDVIETHNENGFRLFLMIDKHNTRIRVYIYEHKDKE